MKKLTDLSIRLPSVAVCRLGWLTCVLAVSSASSALAQSTLPVFSLAPAKVDEQKLLSLARTIAPSGDFTRDLVKRQGSIAYRSGRVVADIETSSGGMFVADLGSVWNALASPTVPSADQSKLAADRFLAQQDLLRVDKYTRLVFKSSSETGAGADTGATVEKKLISRHITYGAQIATTGNDGAQLSVPVVGGGGELRVSVGDGGRVVAYQGGWRELTGIVETVRVGTREEAVKQARTALEQAGVKVTSLRAELAYYAAPSFQAQAVLAPVWTIGGSVQVGGQSVPLRVQYLAASKYGPVFPAGDLPGKRDANTQPKDQGGDERSTQRTVRDLFLPRAHAAETVECGTSWIGVSGGLGGSAGNRQGFKDRCRSGGGVVNFDWGDAAAWEADWTRNDDSYVDAADIVFYTGHANENGWSLATPDDGWLNFTEVSGAVDRYGATDLEWVTIAACGPFESNHFVGGGVGNAFDRWRPMFDGLHIALGYGAVTYDNDAEGRRQMELAQSGWNMIDAWFRTAAEIQPSTNGYAAPYGPNIFAVVMLAHNGDGCTFDDHLWGFGKTCADVPAGGGQQRHMIWSGT